MSRVEKYQDSVQAALKEAEALGLYAIVRVQDKESASVRIVNDKTQQKSKSSVQGMGISVFSQDGTTAFGSIDDPTVENTLTLMKALNGAVRASKNIDVQKNTSIFGVQPETGLYIPQTPYPLDQQNLSLLEQALRSGHNEVQKRNQELAVDSSFVQVDDQWWISRSDGTSVIQSVPTSFLFHNLNLGDGGQKVSTNARVYGIDAGLLLDSGARHQEMELKIGKAYGLLDRLLVAEQLPEGVYKGLLDASMAGVFTHEAVGHPVESDNGPYSIFADKKLGRFSLGDRVAQSNIDVIDGPVEGKWGDIRYSANGVPRKELVVIEKGILVQSISDVFSADRAGTTINGAGRAENFNSIAIPRMSNTRLIDRDAIASDIDATSATEDEIYTLLQGMGALDNEEQVVMPVQGGGGSVLPDEGTFMFGCNAIYRFSTKHGVELFGASNFSGNTRGVMLTPMRGIGGLVLSPGGHCGKAGQTAKVGDGGHTYLLIDANPEKITYGGK